MAVSKEIQPKFVEYYTDILDDVKYKEYLLSLMTDKVTYTDEAIKNHSYYDKITEPIKKLTIGFCSNTDCMKDKKHAACLYKATLYKCLDCLVTEIYDKKDEIRTSKFTLNFCNPQNKPVNNSDYHHSPKFKISKDGLFILNKKIENYQWVKSAKKSDDINLSIYQLMIYDDITVTIDNEQCSLSGHFQGILIGMYACVNLIMGNNCLSLTNPKKNFRSLLCPPGTPGWLEHNKTKNIIITKYCPACYDEYLFNENERVNKPILRFKELKKENENLQKEILELKEKLNQQK